MTIFGRPCRLNVAAYYENRISDGQYVIGLLDQVITVSSATMKVVKELLTFTEC